MSWFSRKPYKVSRIGVLDGILYKEGSRKMVVGCTMSGQGYAVLAFADRMAWEPPHDSEPLDAEKRRQVMERIEQEFPHPITWVSRGDPSSAPYRVTLADNKDWIEYEEGGQKMLIPCTVSETGDLLLAAMDDISWQPPHDSGTLANEEKFRVMANIGMALPIFTISWKPRK